MSALETAFTVIFPAVKEAFLPPLMEALLLTSPKFNATEPAPAPAPLPAMEAMVAHILVELFASTLIWAPANCALAERLACAVESNTFKTTPPAPAPAPLPAISTKAATNVEELVAITSIFPWALIESATISALVVNALVLLWLNASSCASLLLASALFFFCAAGS